MILKIKQAFLFLALSICMVACTKWDEHNQLTDASLGKDLTQQIKENANLSKFSDLLVKSGYDKVLSSSKTFTVWAPTNTALATLDPAIEADTAKLRLFVANHIATQMYATGMAATPVRIELLNGKFNNMSSTMYDEATIAEANKYVKNGLLHVIDKAIPALINSWQVLETSTAIPVLQKVYMQSIIRKIFDSVRAVQIGVDTSGNPVYQPGTDSVVTNIFLRNVYDLRDESRQYTLFVLTDAAWNTELNRFRPYFATGTADSTTSLTSYDVVKDFAVDGYYTAAAMPDTLTSRFGVRVPIDKSAIVQSIKTSNGIVHIMSRLIIPPVNKLRSFYIEAENYRTTKDGRRGNTFFRDRIDSTTFKPFRDVLVYGHGQSLWWINYRVTGANSVKYRMFWRAVNDFQAATHTQKLTLDSVSTGLGYTTVTPKNYGEVFLGEVTLSRYKPSLDIYLNGANSTTAAINPLVCDYIRLVPVP